MVRAQIRDFLSQWRSHQGTLPNSLTAGTSLPPYTHPAGVVADIPTIGVGKNLLYEGGLTRESVASLLESAARDRPGPAVEEDRERRPTGLEDACCVPLLADSGDLLGAAVRGHHGTSKPLFVSVGHRVGLRTAVEVALQCCRGTRVPEPIRQADLRTRAAVRARWTGPSPDPSRGD